MSPGKTGSFPQDRTRRDLNWKLSAWQGITHTWMDRPPAYPKHTVRAGVHAPIKSVSVPAPISFLPPVKPMSAVHTDRQNCYRRLQGSQFRE